MDFSQSWVDLTFECRPGLSLRDGEAAWSSWGSGRLKWLLLGMFRLCGVALILGICDTRPDWNHHTQLAPTPGKLDSNWGKRQEVLVAVYKVPEKPRM